MASTRPASNFDQQWIAQRNPQIYMAATNAMNGKPVEQWTSGLQPAEIQRVRGIIAKIDPNATVMGAGGRSFRVVVPGPGGGAVAWPTPPSISPRWGSPRPTQTPPAPVSGGGFQTVAPRYVQPNEPGYTPGAMTTTTLSPADLVRFNAGQGPDPSAKTPDLDLTQHGFSPANDSDPPPGGMPAPAVHDVGIGSRISNIAAGGNEALAGALGAPVDLMAGGLNLASRGINAVAGTHIPAIVDPVGGSDSFKHAFGVVGANPDDVTAQDGLDKVLRAGAAGVVSAAIPAGGAAAAVRAGLASAPAAAAAVDALGNFTLPNATLGAVAGVSGDQAAQLVPDEYKPIANVVGGLVGGGGAALLGGGVNSLARLAEPMNSAKPNALLDLAGKPLADSSGRPLNATPGQVQTAGRIIDANSADPAAVRSALANGDPTLVPGSNPTTFQVTRDPMLGQAERGLSRDGGAGSAAFMGNADAANDARVAAIRSIAPDADVSALPQAAQAQAAALDASGQARIQALQAAGCAGGAGSLAVICRPGVRGS